jgi:hypothetical protein
MGIANRSRAPRVCPIESCPLPEGALLGAYARTDAYADCYVADVAGTIACARYIEAFYTTPLFKLERLILGFAVSRPSTDAQARQLADAQIDAFAAWRVEARTHDQLLMCDLFGNTRSWFMAAPIPAEPTRTRLYFGSAVTETAMRRPLFGKLLGLHVRYSKALLSAARRRIESRSR